MSLLLLFPGYEDPWVSAGSPQDLGEKKDYDLEKRKKDDDEIMIILSHIIVGGLN